MKIESRKFSSLRLSVFYLLITVSSLFSQNISAQSIPTFSITEKGKAEDISSYTEALNKADMSNYRLLFQRVKIHFENGITVELFSAKELSEKGMKINLNDFREEFPANFQMPEFTLKDGYIIALYKPRDKK